MYTEIGGGEGWGWVGWGSSWWRRERRKFFMFYTFIDKHLHTRLCAVSHTRCAPVTHSWLQRVRQTWGHPAPLWRLEHTDGVLQGKEHLSAIQTEYSLTRSMSCAAGCVSLQGAAGPRENKTHVKIVKFHNAVTYLCRYKAMYTTTTATTTAPG